MADVKMVSIISRGIGVFLYARVLLRDKIVSIMGFIIIAFLDF